MNKKTKYRIYLYKGIKYLLYKKVYGFWFIKWSKWLTIKYPNDVGKPKIICDKIPEYENLKKFIIKYPNIKNYFKSNEFLERKNKYRSYRYR